MRSKVLIFLIELVRSPRVVLFISSVVIVEVIKIVNEIFWCFKILCEDIRIWRCNSFHIGFVRSVDNRNGAGAERITPEFLGDVSVAVYGVLER
jgi:hypothetical protein